jgi:predicted Zn-dependent peptidase
MSKRLKIIIAVMAVTLISAPIFLKKEKKFINFFEYVDSCGVKTHQIRIKSSNVVYVKCKFKNAGVLHNFREKHGISVVTGDLLCRKIGGLSPEETEEKIRELGMGDLNVNASEDDFVLSFFVLKDKAEAALKFLSSAFCEPEFSKSDLEFIKSRYPQILDSETSHPDELLSDELMKALYCSHNYGLPSTGTAQAVGSITEDDVRDFIKSNFSKDMLEVFFVGDVSRSEIESYIEIMFSKLPKSDPDRSSSEDRLNCPSSKDDFIFVYKKDMKEITGVITGIRLDNLSDTEKAAALVILRSLFDEKYGDFLAGLREQNITCSVSSNFLQRRCSDVFYFFVYLDNKDLVKYKKYVQDKMSACRYKLNLKNLNFFQDSAVMSSQNGFTDFVDIDKQIDNSLLPFSKITQSDFLEVAKKIFDESLRRTVYIGAEV